MAADAQASRTGRIRAIDAVALGNAARALVQADAFGGIRASVRVGDAVEMGATLAETSGGSEAKVVTAFDIVGHGVPDLPIIYDVI